MMRPFAWKCAAAGACLCLAAVLVAAPASAQGTCMADNDCPGKQVCEAGSCVDARAATGAPATTGAPAAAAGAAAGQTAAAAGAAGARCAAAKDCASGLSCEGGTCTSSETPAEWTAPSVRLGLGMLIAPGLSGDFKNPTLGLGVMGDLSPALGDNARYHFGIGYEHWTSVNGLRMEPVTFGFPAVVARPGGGSMAFELEPGIWGFNTRYMSAGGKFNGWIFSSGVFLQTILSGSWWFACIMPVGLEFPYLAAGGGSTASKFGMNYITRFGFGAQM